jgi:hypothetical protein
MRSMRFLRSKFLLVGALVALLVLLAACGTNTGSTPTTPPSASPSPAANTNGCPSSAVVTTAPSPANVVLKPANNSSTVTAHVGDVIEIDLPFGHAWTGPTTSQGQLQLQPPAGFALTTAKACVWRFTAQGAGTTQLEFYGKAICQKGQSCPLYIMRLPYTIVVQ